MLKYYFIYLIVYVFVFEEYHIPQPILSREAMASFNAYRATMERFTTERYNNKLFVIFYQWKRISCVLITHILCAVNSKHTFYKSHLNDKIFCNRYLKVLIRRFSPTYNVLSFILNTIYVKKLMTLQTRTKILSYLHKNTFSHFWAPPSTF